MNREQKLQMLGKLKALQQLKAQRQAPQQEQQQRLAYDPATDPTSPQNIRYLDKDDPWYKKLGHGVALSGMETGLGIKDIFTDLSENDQAVLKQMRTDMDEAGGWGTGGKVLGELAQLALPASKVAKVSKLKDASKLKQALATMGAEGALGGAYEATKVPGEGRTRLDEAKKGAAWGTLGSGVGQALGKTLRGIKQSEAGQYLTDLGVKLTPGQAAKGGLPRALEYMLGLAPGTAKSVIRQKQVADDTFSTAMLQQAAPPGGKITGSGYQGMKDLKDSYTKAYSEAWKDAGEVSDDVLEDVMIKTQNMAEAGAESAGPIRRLNAKTNQYLDNKSSKNLDRLDDQLRQEISRIERSQNPNWDLAEYLDDMRSTLRAGTSQKTRDALEAINKQYGKFKTVERAAGSLGGMRSGEGLQGGFFGGDELAGASKAMGKGRSSYGVAPLQTESKAALETIARKDPVPLMNVVRGIARQIEIPLTGRALDKGGDIMLGRATTQKKLRQLAELLRSKGITAGAVGTAAAPD